MTRRLPGFVVGILVALLLVAASMIVPAVTGWNVNVGFPPLHAHWMPRVGPGTLPAIALGALAVLAGPRLAARVGWRALLLVVFLVALAWMLALATVDGLDGLQRVLELKSEYLNTAREVDDVGAMLREYISRIPLDSEHHWPIHLAGHPPGAVLFFIGLVRIGLGSGLAAGLAVAVVAATTPVAVLVALRRLGVEAPARVAAPFLSVGAAAIWMAVSADAMFGAVAAWGLCALAASATARGRVARAVWGLVAGALLGYSVFLSYGLVLLAVLALAVLVAARSWRPLPWTLAAALGVVLAFAAAGFAWWEAYPVLSARYWGGIASDRPAAYWMWGDLAALVFSAGPAVGASVVLAVGRLRRIPAEEDAPAGRVVTILALAAIASIALADLSQMSRAEVERIWLPFVPWLLLGTAFLPARARRPVLAVQVVGALLVQHLFDTTW